MKKLALLVAIVVGAVLVHVSADPGGGAPAESARTEAGVVHYAAR